MSLTSLRDALDELFADDKQRSVRVADGFLNTHGWSDSLLAFFGLSAITDGIEKEFGSCRVIFSPSFGWDSCIEVSSSNSATAVSLTTFGTNLYHWCTHKFREASGGGKHRVPPAGPQRWSESGRCAPSLCMEYIGSLPSSLEPPTGKRAVLIGDGMRLFCGHRIQNGSLQSWNGGSCENMNGLSLARSVHRLAFGVLRTAESKQALESAEC